MSLIKKIFPFLIWALSIIFAPSVLGEEIVKFKNNAVNRCLNVHAGRDNREGGSVTMFTCANTADQEWVIIESGGSWIKLKNRSTSRCLNIHRGRDDREGGLITLYTCANTPDQEWKFIRSSGGVLKLQNRSTSRCLNVHRGQHNFEGAPATSYTCAESPDQRWSLITLSDNVGSATAELTQSFQDINSPTRNATVRLSFPAPIPSPCSGVLISPTLVLTAGHCWDPAPRPRPAGVTPFSTTDWETPGDWYPLPAGVVARIGSNDSQSGTNYQATQYTLAGNTDIIMFRLQNPVPRSQAIPASVVTTDGPEITSSAISNFLNGKTLRVAGWGGVSGGGLPRFRQTIADLRFNIWPETDFNKTALFAVSSSSGATIQGGDSGGPLYWQDGSVLRLLGITQAEGRHVMTFFRGGRDPDGTHLPDLAMWIDEALNREDCVSFNSERIRTQRFGSRWQIIEPIPEGNHMIFDFKRNRADADRALAIIRGYSIDQSCYLNRPGSNFRYMLNGGDLPSGQVGGEDCSRINSSNLIYEERDGRWFIKTPNGNSLFAFEYNRGPDGNGGTATSRYAGFNEAHYAMTLMRQKNARYLCYVGRPNPGLIYFRR